MVQEIPLTGIFPCDKCSDAFTSERALNGHSASHVSKTKRGLARYHRRVTRKANKAAVKAPAPGPKPARSLLERLDALEREVDRLNRLVGVTLQ